MGYVASGAYATYATSADGITWTTYRTMNVSTGTSVYPTGACISPVTGRIVAVGYNYISPTCAYATSTNATTWTIGNLGSSSSGTTMKSVAVNSAGLFIAVGNETPVAVGLFSICSDGTGTNWTTPARFNGSATGMSNPFIATNSSGTWVAVGSANSFRSSTVFSVSTNDGVSWTTPATMSGTATLYGANSIVWNATKGYFVVSLYQDSLSSTGYAYSTDGTTWTVVTASGVSGLAMTLANGAGRNIMGVSGGAGSFYQTFA
jgi:hypothetical protein